MKELLSSHAPSDLVCFGGEGARTRAQFVHYIEAIAHGLPEAKPGDQVVLACIDRYRFAASLLAVWRRGLVVALPPNGQLETVRELRAASSGVALLHDLDEEGGFDVRSVEQSQRSSEATYAPYDYADRAALIVYTSGSTGTPSAHPKSLRQMLAEPSMWIESFDLARRRVLSCVPAHHIYGLLFGVLLPLQGGGAMSRATPVMPSEVLREIASSQAEVLVAVPPHLRALAAYIGGAWPVLKRVLSSGGPLPDSTDKALRAQGVVATQVLGSTETGGIAMRESCESAWSALPQVTLELSDAGCLLVRSPWAAIDPEQVVPTADRAELHTDQRTQEPQAQRFQHLGRADSVVKIGGKRVDLREVEARLSVVKGVREARVFEAPVASSRGVELWAAVECEDPYVTPAELKRVLSAHLDPVQIPRRFRVVRELPRNAAGKVTRAALIALFDVWHLHGEDQPDGSVLVPVPAELGFFRGHFTGQPILAGVVQLQRVALSQARRRWPDLAPDRVVVGRVTRLKFKRLVLPGEVLSLRLTRKSPEQVQFELRVGEEAASSGVLHFRPATGGQS